MNCKICSVIIPRQDDGIELETRKPLDFKKDVKDEVFICSECNKYPLTLIHAFTKVGNYMLSLKNGITSTFSLAKYLDRQWMQTGAGTINKVEIIRSELKIDDISMISEISPIP